MTPEIQEFINKEFGGKIDYNYLLKKLSEWESFSLNMDEIFKYDLT
jgi:hypothetical protein